MFDQSRFNQGAFNVPFDDTLVYLQTDAYETVGGIFGVAVIAYMGTNANETISNESVMNAGILLRAALAESITADCHAIGVITLSADAAEDITATATLGAEYYLATMAAEDVAAAVTLGAEYYLAASLMELVTGAFSVGCVAHMPGQSAYEIIAAACDIEAQDVIELVIDTALGPGQKLVIDSDGYVVLLDGDNIVDKHSGRWVWIDRLTRSIRIETGSSASLESSMLYTERWL